MRNKSLIGSLVALALGAAPAVAVAAGLGKLNILSGIGQPLVAEIDLVSVRADELSTLTARIPPPDTFRRSNMNFNPVLVGARATIERRPGGAPFVRITSGRAIDEPYIDLLVELTWNTGRLVREYTALVDPPSLAPKTQVATPSPAAPQSAPVAVASAAAAPRTQPGSAASGGGAAGTDAPGSYGPVQPGDTLHKIASSVRPEGVSVEQALVGIYRTNSDAFINNNMNLLRSGRVLRIPDAAELSKIPSADAANEVRLQAADWNAYRQRVAGAAPETQPGDARMATGRVSRVEEPGAAEQPGKEVVKVSKGAPGQGAGGTESGLQERIRVLEEEATAREKMLKEANDRIASMEKTLKDMQRLLELKGAAMPPPPAVTPPPPAAEAPPSTGTPAPSEPAKAPSEAATTTAEAKPEAAAPPPPPEPKPETKAEAAPPPPAAEWWEDPALVGAALAGLGVLGGVGFLLARRRRASSEADTFGAEPTFRASAAPAAAAAVAIPEHTAELAPAAVAAAAPPADDVDPIQEADVYIAYGRDAQAEEILKEALAKNPGRQDIKLKLLEIYAARRSKNDFNGLATELHEATQGQGDLWLKVATMGFALDPDNVLYAAGKDSASLPQVGMATDVNLDFDLDMVTAAGAPTTVSDAPLRESHDDTVKTMTLSPERMEALRAEGAVAAGSATDPQAIVPDIDVLDVQPAPLTDVTLQPVRSGPITDINLELPQAGSSNVIDFEFDPSKTVRIEAEAAAAFSPDQTVIISPENQQQARDLGLEIDLGALDAPATEKLPEAPPTVGAEKPQDISFDFELPPESPPTVEMGVPPTDIKLDVPEHARAASAPSMDFALDTVSLHLGSLEKTEVPEAPVRDDHWYDVQTKFDLAKAYQEMGDKDGAREILAEVIKEGDAQQKAEADELMAKLS